MRRRCDEMTKLRKTIVYIALILVAVITLIPFAYLACSAFKTNQDFFSSLFLPAGNGLFGVGWSRLTKNHFERLITELHFHRYILNSLFISSVTSVGSTLCCAMGGYALAKFKFLGRRLVMTLVLAALILPAALLIAPSYELLFRLNLLDSYGGLILPALAPAFGVFLFRQATISSLPTALLEAARMDGCGEIRMFFTIALPMVKPMIGAFMMLTFIGTWNNFIAPQIVLQTDQLFPLS